MSPEDRAKAVVAYFPAIPERSRPLVQEAVTRAIKRALSEQLTQLEYRAASMARAAEGRGKQAKGRDPWAIKFHGEWERVFEEQRARVQ